MSTDNPHPTPGSDWLKKLIDDFAYDLYAANKDLGDNEKFDIEEFRLKGIYDEAIRSRIGQLFTEFEGVIGPDTHDYIQIPGDHGNNESTRNILRESQRHQLAALKRDWLDDGE